MSRKISSALTLALTLGTLTPTLASADTSTVEQMQQESKGNGNARGKTAPVITGVENSLFYNDSVTPKSDDTDIKTVLLNNQEYVLGTPITDEGNYTLVVADRNRNSTTVNFTIDKTPPETPTVNILDNDLFNANGVIPIISSAPSDVVQTVYLDNEIYTGGVINTDGYHTLQITNTDKAGNSSTLTVNFRVDVIAPSAPNNIQVTRESDGINVTWDVPDDDTEGYNVYVSENGSEFTLANDGLIYGTSFKYTSAQRYAVASFKVQAVDHARNVGTQSDTSPEIETAAKVTLEHSNDLRIRNYTYSPLLGDHLQAGTGAFFSTDALPHVNLYGVKWKITVKGVGNFGNTHATLYTYGWETLGDFSNDSHSYGGVGEDSGFTSYSDPFNLIADVSLNSIHLIIIAGHAPLGEYTITQQLVDSDNIPVSEAITSPFTLTKPNEAPTVIEYERYQHGTAVPASVDGNTPAIPYTGNVSNWFTDPESDRLTYFIDSVTDYYGKPINVNVNLDSVTGEIAYIPNAEQADNYVRINVKANDGRLESTAATIIITIGSIPPNQE